MLDRPEDYSEIKGHEKILRFVIERIQQNTYPDCSMLIGEEGIGKTTIAKVTSKALNCQSNYKPCNNCDSCKEITENVIRKNTDTNSVVTVKMTVKESYDKANAVLENLNKGFSKTGRKVVIIEEAHNMTTEAQDILNPHLEYIPKNTYVIACTKDLSKFDKTFLSRFVPINLSRLSPKDMVTILKVEASKRQLNIQGGEATFGMIASWAENKPRQALKVLEAMGKNNNVTMQDIKDFISFLDLGKVIPIISSFSGSVVIGIQSVMEMPMDVNTHSMLVDVLGEAVKFSLGQKSFKFSNEDNALLREAVSDIDSSLLIQFLYEVANMTVFTRNGLLAAYLKVHPQRKSISKYDPDVLGHEINTKYQKEQDTSIKTSKDLRPPSLKSLIMNGTRLGDDKSGK
jgi:DNA polymerase III delta prime subunit